MGTLGAARERIGDEDWHAFVDREMCTSGVVAISLGRSAGLLWELARLVERRLLDRVLILFPPVADVELRARWAEVAPMLVPASLPADPAATLVAIVVDGRLRAFIADQRDEAGYRAAIAAALAAIGFSAALSENSSNGEHW